MRGIVIASVTALLMGAATAGAQESSVYVNLSALDALDAETVVEPAVPLFPIFKPQPKKAAAVKTPPAKVKKRAAKKPVPKVEVKVIEPAKPQSIEEDKPAPIPYVDSVDEVIVVDVEPVTAGNVAAPAAKSAVENKPANETAPDMAAEPDAVSLVQPVSDVPPAVAAAEPGSPETLLLNPQDKLSSPGGFKIAFAEGESGLDDRQKALIDGIVSSFADAANNKIAIYSYNLDDGVDSFKKKRQSLNRAVEIRSYLLQKGYKNFSIKVLNVDGGSDKINSVELEELK